MRYLGVQHIPTFECPTGRPPGQGEKTSFLGRACGGLKIDKCRSWLQARAPKRVTDGKELRVVVDDRTLETVLCRICKG